MRSVCFDAFHNLVSIPTRRREEEKTLHRSKQRTHNAITHGARGRLYLTLDNTFTDTGSHTKDRNLQICTRTADEAPLLEPSCTALSPRFPNDEHLTEVNIASHNTHTITSISHALVGTTSLYVHST